MKKYKTLVFIGRFQPCHLAHLRIIKKALSLADNLVIVVGSADHPRTYKNPFTSSERIQMLSNVIVSELGSARARNVKFGQVRDRLYNDAAWATAVQEQVSQFATGSNIGIIGCSKDETSYYLKMFPQWKHEEVDLEEPLHATDIRGIYFKEDVHLSYLDNVVPPAVLNFLDRFKETAEFSQLVREREFVASYKKQYASFPYPPVFVTTDAVVVCSGHVLMIKRRSEPGKGLWALPGGFLNANTDKSVEDAAIRELREETGIKVPVPVLVGSIEKTKVFDAIERSARGRTITHAFYISLGSGELPKVKGQDDAEKAKWIPLSDLRSEKCFEDHYDIVMWGIGA